MALTRVDQYLLDTEISAEITANAVDVFIYDTSKDSDGGAWRKRTQRTSWYNETLNTATRGSRREFPSVAVIVAETDKVTIYDGDDPDLPMWMVFLSPSTTPYNLIPNVSGDITSITALNGKISLGYHHNYGLGVWDFISEFCITAWRENSRLQYAGTIAERNDQKGSLQLGAPYILTYVVNDVAMTVLPNAPIDSATGLPVPTIAVATAGGVSVIKDDGTVVDITWSSYGIASSVYFKDNYLWLTNDSGIFNKGGRYLKKYSIPSSDISESHGYLRNSALKYWASPWGFLGAYTGTSYPPLLGSNSGFYGPTVGPYWGSSDGTNGGITFIGDEGTTTTDGLVAYATTSYNTGWMHRDIKGAFLSDTTAESLTANTNLATNAIQYGTERLTSETYDDGDTSWQMVDNAGNDNGYVMIQLNGLTVGQSYLISVTFDNNNALDGTYQHRIDHDGGSSGSTNFTHWNKTNASSETLTGLFTAKTVNSDYFVLYANAITLNVSNFIVRAVDDEDRSVNNKGLQVYGTITKSAVATGAELVAYSGFSASNYLSQPYNSDLEFGTGDFYMMAWVKNNDTTNNQKIMTRDVDNNNRLQLYMLNSSGYKFAIYTQDAGSNSYLYTSSTGVNNGQWSFIVAGRKSSTLQMYYNGNYESGVGSNTNIARDLSFGGSSPLEIGRTATDTANYWRGSIALARIGAGFPSPEQIKKIYEDEKVLFQENAACTLYGSSDAVTALAYDDTTSLLHVGTSSGRSDFQGLRRISNTTTPITTVISAHDGFIVEQ